MQAGLINGIQYLGGGLIAPIWGVIADRKNAHRCMSVFVALMAVLCTCAVPLLVEILGGNFCFQRVLEILVHYLTLISVP